AFLARQSELKYVPIDISAEFLLESSTTLRREFSRLSVAAIAGEYWEGLRHLPEPDGRRLFLFLGSNIGNFDPSEASQFLCAIRTQMNADDRLLVGIDRLKDRSILEPAYNDSQGITEAFNKNVLLRINSELGGEFDLDSFEHSAPFVQER